MSQKIPPPPGGGHWSTIPCLGEPALVKAFGEYVIGTVLTWDDARTYVKVRMPNGGVQSFPYAEVKIRW